MVNFMLCPPYPKGGLVTGQNCIIVNWLMHGPVAEQLRVAASLKYSD
jgi:hypothetical protein